MCYADKMDIDEKDFLEFTYGFINAIEEYNIPWTLGDKHKIEEYKETKNIQPYSTKKSYIFKNEKTGETFSLYERYDGTKVFVVFFEKPIYFITNRNEEEIGQLNVIMNKHGFLEPDYEYGKKLGIEYSKLYKNLSEISIENEIIHSFISFFLKNKNEKHIKVSAYKTRDELSIKIFFFNYETKKQCEITAINNEILEIEVEKTITDRNNFSRFLFNQPYRIKITAELLKKIASGELPKEELSFDLEYVIKNLKP